VVEDWKWGDWSKLPDEYTVSLWGPDQFPKEWLGDYLALLNKLQDPDFGRHLCVSCVVHRADWAKEEIDRDAKHWEQNGGEAAGEQWYGEVGEEHRLRFLKEGAMRGVKWRVFNELGEANNRTCKVVNYFKCPYGEERQELLDNGRMAYEIWNHIKWYDDHWNPNHTWTPAAIERKWYHYGESQIIDVTSFDDVCKALDDGRFDIILEEHLKYMKDMAREIWAL
jgi:hypothetical protein